MSFVLRWKRLSGLILMSVAMTTSVSGQKMQHITLGSPVSKWGVQVEYPVNDRISWNWGLGWIAASAGGKFFLTPPQKSRFFLAYDQVLYMNMKSNPSTYSTYGFASVGYRNRWTRLHFTAQG